MWCDRSLKRKNEAKLQNKSVDGKLYLGRAHTAERAKLDKLLLTAKESRTRRKSGNQQNDSRSSSKSSLHGTPTQSTAKKTVNRSLESSINDENLENSLNKSIDRSFNSSSKKSIERKSKKPEESLLSKVYSVKKQSYSKLSPVRKGICRLNSWA